MWHRLTQLWVNLTLPWHTALAGHTWQIKQDQTHCIWVQLLHLSAEQEAATSQRAHQGIQQVEHLLRCPTILWHTQLNANQLHLHSISEAAT